MWQESVDIFVTLTCDSLINCLIFEATETQPWQLTLIYSPPVHSFRQQFLDKLGRIATSFNGEWMITGDFNMVLDSSDKTGGRPSKFKTSLTHMH